MRTEVYDIYIILSNSPSIISKVIGLYTKDEYTHAAISIDEDIGTIYGMGRKWSRFPFVGRLKQEEMDKGFYSLCPNLPGAIYKLSINKDQYNMLRKTLHKYLKEEKVVKYNNLGIFSCMINKDLGPKDKFTCSAFVAHLLETAKIANFDLPPALVRPQSLTKLNAELVFKGDLKSYFSHQALANE